MTRRAAQSSKPVSAVVYVGLGAWLAGTLTGWGWLHELAAAFLGVGAAAYFYLLSRKPEQEGTADPDSASRS